MGNRRQWSNFRRFTYFVSAELTNKTFLTRVGDGGFLSLEKIKDVFSVEKVTKEFYEQYRKLFEALLGDLDKNRAFQIVASKSQINTSDFAKKLLGQVVFLYFLQKKGWLGVPQDKRWGDGDKNFISNLYKRAVKKNENFYNDYLEILFYDTLNNANREGADPSFSKYFNCRIPFLNGGLFEPEYDWHGTRIYLENGVFRNIFEVFDRYNFTVEEESPDDKEVAVDPEMLGKVFENLLEENLRKGKGTYYTPREIVHYMCRESLINYLVTETKTDEKLIQNLVTFKDITPEQVAEAMNNEDAGHRMVDRSPTYWEQEGESIEKALLNIKVCDPACGSGAFLVGMLNEIVSVRRLLDFGKSEYQMKKETIENCIYGVDIDPGAVEIAKLRLWLSLVVDYELADIEPLPNLDYKIMCGNSLLEELIVGDESIELFDPQVLDKNKPKRKTSDKLMQMDFLKQDPEEYLKILRKLHIEYFHETDTQKKKTIRSRIEKIEMDFIQSSVDSRVKAIETQIRNLNMQKPEDRKKNAALMKKKFEYMAIPNDIRGSKVRPYFLWHLNFFEVFQEKGGFDIVIANPPYIGHKGGQKKFFQGIKKASLGKRFNNERMDIFYYFFHLALDIGRNNAEGAFITTNYYITADSAVKLRSDLKARANVRKLISFNELKIFESALGQHNMITSFVKDFSADQTCEVYSTKQTGFASPQILKNILEKNDKHTAYGQVRQSKLYEGSKNYIRLFDSLPEQHDKFEILFQKIKNNSIILGKACDISQGIVTGLDKISPKHIKKMPDLETCEGNGCFILNNAEKIKVGASPLLKPWFKNSDIDKFRVNERNEYWLIHLYTDINLENYRNIHKHIAQFERIIKSRNFDSGELSKAKRLGKWWALASARKEFSFDQPKIISPQRSFENTFAYTEKPWYASADVYFIAARDKSIELKYVLALLNSRLYYFWLWHKGKRKGNMLELYLTPLSEIPIKQIDPTQQKPFIELVDQILKIVQGKDSSEDVKQQARVKEYERQIDQMVYKLYGLTEEEVKIVESTSAYESNSRNGKPIKSCLEKAGLNS